MPLPCEIFKAIIDQMALDRDQLRIKNALLYDEYSRILEQNSAEIALIKDYMKDEFKETLTYLQKRLAFLENENEQIEKLIRENSLKSTQLKAEDIAEFANFLVSDGKIADLNTLTKLLSDAPKSLQSSRDGADLQTNLALLLLAGLPNDAKRLEQIRDVSPVFLESLIKQAARAYKTDNSEKSQQIKHLVLSGLYVLFSRDCENKLAKDNLSPDEYISFLTTLQNLLPDVESDDLLQDLLIFIPEGEKKSLRELLNDVKRKITTPYTRELANAEFKFYKRVHSGQEEFKAYAEAIPQRLKEMLLETRQKTERKRLQQMPSKEPLLSRMFVKRHRPVRQEKVDFARSSIGGDFKNFVATKLNDWLMELKDEAARKGIEVTADDIKNKLTKELQSYMYDYEIDKENNIVVTTYEINDKFVENIHKFQRKITGTDLTMFITGNAWNTGAAFTKTTSKYNSLSDVPKAVIEKNTFLAAQIKAYQENVRNNFSNQLTPTQQELFAKLSAIEAWGTEIFAMFAGVEQDERELLDNAIKSLLTPPKEEIVTIQTTLQDRKLQEVIEKVFEHTKYFADVRKHKANLRKLNSSNTDEKEKQNCKNAINAWDIPLQDKSYEQKCKFIEAAYKKLNYKHNEYFTGYVNTWSHLPQEKRESQPLDLTTRKKSGQAQITLFEKLKECLPKEYKLRIDSSPREIREQYKHLASDSGPYRTLFRDLRDSGVLYHLSRESTKENIDKIDALFAKEELDENNLAEGLNQLFMEEFFNYYAIAEELKLRNINALAVNIGDYNGTCKRIEETSHKAGNAQLANTDILTSKDHAQYRKICDEIVNQIMQDMQGQDIDALEIWKDIIFTIPANKTGAIEVTVNYQGADIPITVNLANPLPYSLDKKEGSDQVLLSGVVEKDRRRLKEDIKAMTETVSKMYVRAQNNEPLLDDEEFNKYLTVIKEIEERMKIELSPQSFDMQQAEFKVKHNRGGKTQTVVVKYGEKEYELVNFKADLPYSLFKTKGDKGFDFSYGGTRGSKVFNELMLDLYGRKDKKSMTAVMAVGKGQQAFVKMRQRLLSGELFVAKTGVVRQEGKGPTFKEHSAMGEVASRDDTGAQAEAFFYEVIFKPNLANTAYQEFADKQRPDGEFWKATLPQSYKMFQAYAKGLSLRDIEVREHTGYSRDTSLYHSPAKRIEAETNKIFSGIAEKTNVLFASIDAKIKAFIDYAKDNGQIKAPLTPKSDELFTAIDQEINNFIQELAKSNLPSEYIQKVTLEAKELRVAAKSQLTELLMNKIVKIDEINQIFSTLTKNTKDLFQPQYATRIALESVIKDKLSIFSSTLNVYTSKDKFFHHCDIKPENLIVRKVAGHYQVEIIDIGTLAAESSDFQDSKMFQQLCPDDKIKQALKEQTCLDEHQLKKLVTTIYKISEESKLVVTKKENEICVKDANGNYFRQVRGSDGKFTVYAGRDPVIEVQAGAYHSTLPYIFSPEVNGIKPVDGVWTLSQNNAQEMDNWALMVLAFGICRQEDLLGEKSLSVGRKLEDRYPISDVLKVATRSDGKKYLAKDARFDDSFLVDGLENSPGDQHALMHEIGRAHV